MNGKFYATSITNDFGLIKGQQYILKSQITGSVYVYDMEGKYITYYRKNCFNNWKEAEI